MNHVFLDVAWIRGPTYVSRRVATTPSVAAFCSLCCSRSSVASSESRLSRILKLADRRYRLHCELGSPLGNNCLSHGQEGALQKSVAGNWRAQIPWDNSNTEIFCSKLCTLSLSAFLLRVANRAIQPQRQALYISCKSSSRFLECMKTRNIASAPHDVGFNWERPTFHHSLASIASQSRITGNLDLPILIRSSLALSLNSQSQMTLQHSNS